MDHAPGMAQQNAFPGAVPRNLESYGQSVDFDQAMPTWQQHLLVDPQTSGGLLLAVSRDAAESVLQFVQSTGCSKAAVIGSLLEGEARVKVQGSSQ
jgi:selenide,water dikinase